MSSRIKIYGPGGHYLTEIDAVFYLYDQTRGSFSLSFEDPKCTKKYLEFGNIVLVEREGLQPWAGVINTPREWSDEAISVNCINADDLLAARIINRTK